MCVSECGRFKIFQVPLILFCCLTSLSFPGVGYANIVMNFFMVCYFNVVLAWLARYLIASFSAVLPWNSCNNTWNTEDCITISLNGDMSLVVVEA